MRGAGCGCPGTLASGWGMLQLLKTPAVRLFSQENHDVQGFGILSGLPQGGSVSGMISLAQEVWETVVSPTC